MSEIPELRAAVRASAERRYGRRRRSSRSLPVLAVAAILVALFVLAPRPAPDEMPAVTPSPTAPPDTRPTPSADTKERSLALLGSVYGVFRRPQRAADRPDGLLGATPPFARDVTLDPTGMRRLAVSGDFKLYGVPGLQNGRTWLCVVTSRRSRLSGASCGPFEPGTENTRPRWGRTFYRPASLFSLLVPDGTATVKVHLKSGEVLTKRVQDNAVLFTAKGLNRIVWRAADGTTHSTGATV